MRFVFALLLCACARPPALSTGPPPPSRLAGRLLVAQLDDEVSTQRCERTRFGAHLVAPAARRGEKVRGRVVRCDAGYGSTPARLVLAVDAPAHARVTSLPLEALAKSPDGQPARNGAVGGAVIGAVLMGLPGAWIGYSVGSAGGIVKEVAAKIDHVRIPKGALLTLEQP